MNPFKNSVKNSRRALAAACLGLLSSVACVNATASSLAIIGSAVVNVRDMGAYGDGVHDDTTAFQTALNALKAGGGTVQVPAGKYMIDTSRSVSMLDHTRLQLASGAQLAAIPNNNANYNYVVLMSGVSNVEITGGQIVGERYQHIGNAGQWGFGIYVRGGSRIDIHDIQVSNFWGDGISVTRLRWAPNNGPGYAQSIRIYNVVSEGNRRQGLSVGSVQHLWVRYSQFLNSNGTDPQTGIDIEPDPGYPANDVEIGNSQITGNAGSGIQIYNNATDIQVQESQINNNNGFGILVVGTDHGLIANNTFTSNGGPGVQVRTLAQYYQVNGNTFNKDARIWNGLSESPLSSTYLGAVTYNTAGLQIFNSAVDVQHQGNRVNGQLTD